jgi:hypothetical protein
MLPKVLEQAVSVRSKPPGLRVASRLGAGAKGASGGSMVAGPLFVDATFKSTDVEIITKFIEEAVTQYLAWVPPPSELTTSDATSWLTSRLVYDRDCLVRAALYTENVQIIGKEAAFALAGKTDMVGHNSLGLGRDD